MPLTGTNYTRTGVSTLGGATSLVYTWSISGGDIVSGQNSLNVTFNFYSTGDQTLSLNVTNDCSSVNSSEIFSLCNLIFNLTINGSLSVQQNSQVSYSATVSSGVLTFYNWSINGQGTSIVSGNFTLNVLIQFGSTGTASLTLDVTDCDNNHYSTTVYINQTNLSCTNLYNVAVTGLSNVTQEEIHTYDVTFSGTQLGATYSWVVLIGCTQISGGNGYNYCNLKFDTVGNKSITCTVTNCSSSDSDTIVVSVIGNCIALTSNSVFI